MKMKKQINKFKPKNLFTNKKGDLRIQEMAFVLLALVLLFAIVFIFAIKLQTDKIRETTQFLGQQRALALRDKIAAFQELKCARAPCIDEDKAKITKDYDIGYLFQGLVKARIVQIYPEDKEIVIYDSGKQIKESFSSFVNLCRQKKAGTAFEYECGLALLVVSI